MGHGGQWGGVSVGWWSVWHGGQWGRVSVGWWSVWHGGHRSVGQGECGVVVSATWGSVGRGGGGGGQVGGEVGGA